jgi:hypothetical protein
MMYEPATTECGSFPGQRTDGLLSGHDFSRAVEAQQRSVPKRVRVLELLIRLLRRENIDIEVLGISFGGRGFTLKAPP